VGEKEERLVEFSGRSKDEFEGPERGAKQIELLINPVYIKG
jgi:hypothetical protein